MTNKKRPIWHKSLFWSKMRDTFAVLGGPTTAGLAVFQAGDKWVMLSGVVATLGALTGIWMTDSNNNGISDIFEDTNGINNNGKEH